LFDQIPSRLTNRHLITISGLIRMEKD